MLGQSRIAVIALLVSLLAFTAAQAQDFRVYTRLFDARPMAGKQKSKTASQPISRSTSLFHAGKVYDYVDSGDRMMVFEPAHERFVILDNARHLETTLTFAEVNAVLYLESRRAEQKLADGVGLTKAKSDYVRFLLAPKFKEQFDKSKHQLDLSSRLMSYQVIGAKSDSPEIVDLYLDYTDWAARLNFIDNPYVPLPGPRLELDAALKRQQLLPVQVTMRIDMENGPHLRAEHQFYWKLDADDRKRIHHWESLRTSGGFKKVTFDEFRRSTSVIEQTSAKR